MPFYHFFGAITLFHEFSLVIAPFSSQILVCYIVVFHIQGVANAGNAFLWVVINIQQRAGASLCQYINKLKCFLAVEVV